MAAKAHGVGRYRKGSTERVHITSDHDDSMDFAWDALRLLRILQESGVLCDVQLLAEETMLDQSEEHLNCVMTKERIPAHRCVLASRSDYFKTMFTIGMNESKQNVINIHGVSHRILTNVVEFIYSGFCISDDIYDLYRAADMLQIPSLLTACEDYLVANLDIHNVFQIYSLADSYPYQLIDILERCKELIENHLGALINHEEFCRIPASIIHAILKLPKVSLGLNHDHGALRKALQSWVMSNNNEEIDKLKKYVNLEKLGVTLPPHIDEGSCFDSLDGSDRIATLPDCFSLIVVIGGFNILQSQTVPSAQGPPSANTVEVFNTSSLTWQSSCSIQTEARPVLFRTVFALDGMLYFLSTDLTIYQYQPIRCQWSVIRHCIQGESFFRRLVHTSTRLVRAAADSGHELYFCGSVSIMDYGYDSGKACYKYDVKKNIVEDLPPLPFPRYQNGLVVVDEDLYVIGGSWKNGPPQTSLFRLRNGHTNWEELSCMLMPRVGLGVAVLGGFIYAAGGTGSSSRTVDSRYHIASDSSRTVERYHIASDSWELIPKMNCRRAFPGAVAAAGCLFIFGGTSSSSESSLASRSCEKFDPSTNCWVELPNMEELRCQMISLRL